MNNNFWDYYKNMIIGRFKQQYVLYKKDKYKGAKEFLSIIRELRGSNLTSKHEIEGSFIDFTKKNNLNYGSVGGILLERLFKFAIECYILENKKDKKIEVINGYSIPYKRKEEGNKQVNVDVVLKSRKTTKLLLCFEIKTNFEDGFKKYYNEQNLIYHHRTKVYKDFKYYYIAFSSIPPNCKEKYKKETKTLIGRGELVLFPFKMLLEKEAVENCIRLLDHILYIIKSQ